MEEADILPAKSHGKGEAEQKEMEEANILPANSHGKGEAEQTMEEVSVSRKRYCTHSTGAVLPLSKKICNCLCRALALYFKDFEDGQRTFSNFQCPYSLLTMLLLIIFVPICTRPDPTLFLTPKLYCCSSSPGDYQCNFGVKIWQHLKMAL